MRKKIDGCVCCGLPCLSYCNLRDESYEYICDRCGVEVYRADLYEYDGEEICQDCLLELVPKAY